MRHPSRLWPPRRVPRDWRVAAARALRASGTLAIVAATALRADATALWLTASGSSGAPGPSALVRTHCGAAATLPAFSFWIWGAVDAGKTLGNVSLNLTSSNASVLDFAASWWNNPAAGGLPRFEFVRDTSASGALPPLVPVTSPGDRIDGLQGFTIDAAAATGLGLAEADSVEGGAARWRIAEIQWRPVAAGTAEIFLQIGENGLNNVGEDVSVQRVTLGRSDDVLYEPQYASHRNATLAGDTADAVLTIRSLTADFNGDGTVDGLDLKTWEAAFATRVGADCTTGDADHDGDVDGRDQLLWQQAFSLARSAPATSAPEPGAAAWRLAACVAAARRRRRAASR